MKNLYAQTMYNEFQEEYIGMTFHKFIITNIEELDRRECKVVPLAENEDWIRIPKIEIFDDNLVEIKSALDNEDFLEASALI